FLLRFFLAIGRIKYCECLHVRLITREDRTGAESIVLMKLVGRQIRDAADRIIADLRRSEIFEYRIDVSAREPAGVSCSADRTGIIDDCRIAINDLTLRILYIDSYRYSGLVIGT